MVLCKHWQWLNDRGGLMGELSWQEIVSLSNVGAWCGWQLFVGGSCLWMAGARLYVGWFYYLFIFIQDQLY